MPGRTFPYDANGNRLLSVTDNAGATVKYGYSGERNKMLALPESVTDALRNTTTNIYDNFGRITGTSLANGSGVVYTYTKGQLSELSRRTGSTSQNYSFVCNSFGRMTELKVGRRMLTSYTYAIGNGNLIEQTYGNGASVAFTYDQQDRVTTRTTSDGKTRTYRYNEDSRLSSVTYDAAGNITEEKSNTGVWKYTYDTQGQLTKATNGSATYTFTYDDAGNILTASDGSQTHTYTYGDSSWKDLLTAYDGHAISYDGSGNPTTYYNGRDWTFGWTGGRTLSSASSSSDTGESSIGYTYDLDGIRTGKTVTEKVYHTHAYTETRTVAPTCTAKGYTVETCSCGATRNTNYVAATGHNYTKTKVVEPTCTAQGYTLNTCTKCGATTRTDYVKALGHDYQKAGMITIGLVCTRCGATYGSGGSGGIGGGDIGPTITPTARPGSMYDGDEGGNETLPPVVDEEVPDETIPPETGETASEEPVQPEGDASVDVQAASQIIASETTSAYSYIYASGKLLQEKVTTNGKTETHTFFYDSTGKPYAMQVDGTTYYYITSLQGDVMGLVDTSGNSVASYTYDPYGKLLTATGTLAEKNPLRYRGYYYDSESGLYYLQSRYYDPAIRRFVNADAYASTGQGIIGTNMFAYCNNDPGNSIDPYGYGYISIGGTSRNNFCELMEDGCSGGAGGGGVAIGILLGLEKFETAVANGAQKAYEKVVNRIESLASDISSRRYSHDNEIHHIVAKKAPNAALAARILNYTLPGGVNNEANLVSLKTGVHKRIHTTLYYYITNAVVINAYYAADGDLAKQRENVIAALTEIKVILVALNEFVG